MDENFKSIFQEFTEYNEKNQWVYVYHVSIINYLQLHLLYDLKAAEFGQFPRIFNDFFLPSHPLSLSLFSENTKRKRRRSKKM